MGFHKTIPLFFFRKLFNIIITLVVSISCQDQEVITNIVASYGKIEISVSDNGNFGGIQKFQKSPFPTVKVKIKNIGQLPISSFEFPEKLPHPLYYKKAPKRGMKIFNQNFAERDSKDLSYRTLKNNEITPELEEQLYVIDNSSVNKCHIINNFNNDSNEFCEFEILVYSEEKIDFISEFEFSYNDGVYKNLHNFSLSGSIADPGILDFSTKKFDLIEEYLDYKKDLVGAGESLIFEPIAFGMSSTRNIQLFNTGERKVYIFAIDFFSQNDYFNFTGGVYPGVNGTCENDLDPHEICSLEIEYKPSFAIDILKRNDETHNSILNLKYFDAVFERSIDIPISGRAKEERGRIEIVKNISNNVDPTCIEIPGQYCQSLGQMALGRNESFSIEIKNVGLIKSTLLPPLIKIESIFENPIYLDLEDQDIKYVNLTAETNNDDRCTDFLEPGESCKIYFDLNTNPMLNNIPIDYIGLRSFLISLPYLDNDIINPLRQLALLENEIPNENNKEIINRVKISTEILRPAILTLSVLEDEQSTKYLDEIIDNENVLELPPSKTNSKIVLNLKIKNVGMFDASQIQIKKDTELTSNDPNFQFNLLKNFCPSSLSSSEKDYCDFTISIQGINKGIYKGVFYFSYFNGVEQVTTKSFEISIYYADPPNLNLRFERISSNMIDYLPFNSILDHFVKNLKSQPLKLILENTGLGSASNIELKLDSEMECNSRLYPAEITPIQSKNCDFITNFNLGPKGSEFSLCEIEFNLTPRIEPDDPNFKFENCKLNITTQYNDEINTDTTFKVFKYNIFDFWVGEASDLFALTSDELNTLFSIIPNELIVDKKTEMDNYIISLDDIILDLGTTPKGIPIKSSFFIYNYGGVNPNNFSFTQDQPSPFEITPSSGCQNWKKTTTCQMDVTFLSNETNAFHHKVSFNYNNGIQTIEKNYYLNATSGDFGNLVYKDSGDNEYETMSAYNLGNFIIQKEGNIQLKFYNNGLGEISNLRFDNIVENTSETTEELDTPPYEILPSSNCLSEGLVLAPNDFCLFDVVLKPTEAIIYNFQLKLLFNNSSEDKKYNITYLFNGRTPPNLQIEFSGGNSNNEFNYGKIPNDSKKEKTFTIRNSGQTNATDFSISLNSELSNFFKITYSTCNIPNKTLEATYSCTIKVSFTPNETSSFDINENDEKIFVPFKNVISVYYDPILPPENETIPFDHINNPIKSINISGISIIPEATFTYYSDIYAVNKNGDTMVRFAWDSFIPGSNEIEIDSHHIYMREGEQLPLNEVELEKYKIDMILGNAKNDRIFTKTLSSNPGDIIYFSIRPKYLENVMNIPIIDQNKGIPWNLKIIIPPENMALIHPFIVNDSTCRAMKYRPDFENSINQENALFLLDPISPPSDVYFSCPKEKILNDKPDESGNQYTYNYYNFNRFLFVNLYELSKTPAGYYYNVENALPHEFNVPITAENACKTKLHNMNTFGNKVSRLLTREEWLAAAEWSPLLSANKLEQIEKGDIITGCFSGKNEQIPVLTGSRVDCASRFGVHDMIGNLWEWNKNQINTVIGLDELLGTYLLVPGGISLEFPKNIPCFNYIHGIGTLPQTKDGKPYCPEGVFGSSISVKNQSYYFPPNPMISGVKQFRSGGGIGEKFGADNDSVKLTGRYVSDLDSSTAFFTGGRCGFSLPFNND